MDYTIYHPRFYRRRRRSTCCPPSPRPSAWDTNREALREQIATTVTALLGLVGMHDIDPLRSREHILLSNIFEQAWRRGSRWTWPS